jgi:hypothetical protein
MILNGRRSQAASDQLRDYFREIVAVKREHPGEDMITRLIAAEEAGDSLTETELYNTCLLLLVAGHETTTRLIGNGLYLLLKSPQQMAALRADPGLIPGAIEEMLRFEPPVQATRRFVTDISLHRRFQPRSAGQRESGHLRYQQARAEPDLVRLRHPPLYRRLIGATGSEGSLRGAAGRL